MKTFEDVIRDIADHLKGLPLNSISGRAVPFSVYDVDFDKRSYFLQLGGGKIKSRPYTKISKQWEFGLSIQTNHGVNG